MDSVIQNSVLDVQLSMEEGLANVLKAFGRPSVLLCDRGPMDGAAYVVVMRGQGAHEMPLSAFVRNVYLTTTHFEN